MVFKMIHYLQLQTSIKAPTMETQIIGKEPGTDYDNAFIKSYDEAVNWLNS
jgi:hypothetical protein